MSDYQDLADQIDELSRRLPRVIKAANLEPAIRDRLARFVEAAIAEEGVLEGMGYYSQGGRTNRCASCFGARQVPTCSRPSSTAGKITLIRSFRAA